MLLLIMGLYSQYINKSHLILHPFSLFHNIKKRQYTFKGLLGPKLIKRYINWNKEYSMPRNITKVNSIINNHYLKVYKHSNH
jgi:hypothetical protein